MPCERARIGGERVSWKLESTGRRTERRDETTNSDDAVVSIIALSLKGSTDVGDGEEEADERVDGVHVVSSKKVV